MLRPCSSEDPILRCKHTSTTVLSATGTGIRSLLIQCIAVLGGQCLACGDIPPGHQPHSASREMHRTMRVAAIVDVPGFLLERLPVDIPAGVEGQERVMASGKAFRAFFLGLFSHLYGRILVSWGISCAVQSPFPAMRERPIHTGMFPLISS